jgi:hypothetical protein
MARKKQPRKKNADSHRGWSVREFPKRFKNKKVSITPPKEEEINERE